MAIILPALPAYAGELAVDLAPNRGVEVRITVRDDQGRAVKADRRPALMLARGSANPLVWDSALRAYRTSISPDAAYTGEYPLRVRAIVGGRVLVHEETPLVLDRIHPALGQPKAVRGLVNTRGTEDSAAISPDGEWLFVQYSPATISCHWVGMDHPFCREARGPWGPPVRPRMPGAERISEDGTIHHGCAPHGLDPMPFAIAPVGLYGFQRQADVSFAAPFVFHWAESSGCVPPYGPSVHLEPGGLATMYLTVEHPSSVRFRPGADVQMGRMSAGWTVRDPSYAPFGYQATGRQGNIHVYHDPKGEPLVEFWDNEDLPENMRRIVFSTRDAVGGWAAPRLLPSPPFNLRTVSETQPYFDAEKMVMRRGHEIVMVPYLGGALGRSASWASPEVLLATQVSGHAVGSIFTLGEPTIARRGGSETLYFVYGLLGVDGAIDLNVGYAERVQ